MSEEQSSASTPGQDQPSGSSVVQDPSAQARAKKVPERGQPKQLPPFKVLLHNDPVNEMEHVVMSILKVTTLSLATAEERMWEAHRTGVSLLLVTHKERAELYEEQFRSFNLTVTIEPDA